MFCNVCAVTIARSQKVESWQPEVDGVFKLEKSGNVTFGPKVVSTCRLEKYKGKCTHGDGSEGERETAYSPLSSEWLGAL